MIKNLTEALRRGTINTGAGAAIIINKTYKLKENKMKVFAAALLLVGTLSLRLSTSQWTEDDLDSVFASMTCGDDCENTGEYG